MTRSLKISRYRLNQAAPPPTNPRSLAPCLYSAHPAPLKGRLETFLFEGGLQVGYWRLNVIRYYLRLATPAG